MANAIRQDLTRGSIPRHLVRLAAPAVASSVLHNLYAINDLWFAGHFVGKAGQGAVGLSLFIAIFTYGLATMVAVGAMAIVSRLTGEGASAARIVRAVRNSLMLAVLLGIAVGAALYPLARPLMNLMAPGHPDVVEAGTTYLRGLFLGLPVLFLVPTLDSLYRARGSAAIPLVMEILAVLANVVLNIVAVAFLHWGVAGIAVATIGSRLAASIVGLVLLARGGLRLKVPLVPPPRPDPGAYRRLLGIGLPAGLRPLLFASVFLVVSGIVARFGVDGLTGLVVGIRIEGVCFLLMFGFGQAVAPMVGQNLGASRPDRAERAAWIGAGFAASAGLVVGLLFLVWPHELMRLLSADEGVVRLGGQYLRIVAVCQIFTALEIAFGQAFVGAGNTLPPLLVSSGFTVLRIPGAFLLGVTLNGGLLAIWWVIAVTAILRGIGMPLWFARGKWKTHRLAGDRSTGAGAGPSASSPGTRSSSARAP